MEELQNRDTCYKCYRPKNSCSCINIQNTLNLNSKFVILMHPKEYRKTKNGTGFMTKNSINNCEVFIGIDFTKHSKINELINNPYYEAFLLYPGEDSLKINEEKINLKKKKALFFMIDSTWPCSKKILRKSLNLQKLKKVSFENNDSSVFKIKTQPNKYCLSTIESTLCLLKELNKQNIENIQKAEFNDFLNPFIKMVEYQQACVIDEKAKVRYKAPYKK